MHLNRGVSDGAGGHESWWRLARERKITFGIFSLAGQFWVGQIGQIFHQKYADVFAIACICDVPLWWVMGLQFAHWPRQNSLSRTTCPRDYNKYAASTNQIRDFFVRICFGPLYDTCPGQLTKRCRSSSWSWRYQNSENLPNLFPFADAFWFTILLSAGTHLFSDAQTGFLGQNSPSLTILTLYGYFMLSSN